MRSLWLRLLRLFGLCRQPKDGLTAWGRRQLDLMVKMGDTSHLRVPPNVRSEAGDIITGNHSIMFDDLSPLDRTRVIWYIWQRIDPTASDPSTIVTVREVLADPTWLILGEVVR